MSKLFQKIKELAKDGMFHIFGGSVVSKVVGVLSTFFVIRHLDKIAYGEYVSANNLFSYFTAFVGLGLANAALQYCSENISESKRNGVYAYSFWVGSISNAILVAAIWVFAAIEEHSGDVNEAYYLRLMSGLPFVIYLHTYLQIVLRIRLNNRAFSFSSMVYSVTMLAGNIVMTIFMGIPGLIISTYFANVAGFLNSWWFLRKSKFFTTILKERETLSRAYKKEITSYAVVYAFTGFSSMILLLLGVTCLDLVLDNPAVLADYKVATTIPTATAFIPSCLLVYFYPKMVHAFSESKESGRTYVKQMMKLFVGANGAIFLLMFLGAPLLIKVGFGDKYMTVVPVFQVLSINYLIHAVQMLYSHVLAVVKRLKANLLLSLFSGAFNIVLNLLLIPWLGSMGVAVATVITTCLITLLYFVYLKRFYNESA